MTAKKTWTIRHQHVHRCSSSAIHTHSFPLGHLKGTYGWLLASLFGPCSHRIEAHLSVSRVWARLSAPGLMLLHGRDALGERHGGQLVLLFLQYAQCTPFQVATVVAVPTRSVDGG